MLPLLSEYLYWSELFKPVWWRRHIRISISASGRKTFLSGGYPTQQPLTIDPLYAFAPPPSCSTFSPGSCEVSVCGRAGGWIGWCLPTVTVCLNAGSRSQPVSHWFSPASVVEKVKTWRITLWHLHQLVSLRCTIQHRDDSWLVSFSGGLGSGGAAVGFRGQKML